jgi:hypothetical protein
MGRRIAGGFRPTGSCRRVAPVGSIGRVIWARTMNFIICEEDLWLATCQGSYASHSKHRGESDRLIWMGNGERSNVRNSSRWISPADGRA